MAAVFSATACLGHQGFPEQPARLGAIRQRLVDDGRFPLIDAPPAAVEFLALRHPLAWLHTIEACAARSEEAGEEVPLGPASWPAILGAAGAVQAAVARALEGTPAFAAIRPPGHHASATRAMGFCAVNLVAVAVAAARQAGCERALIVDWDVHHGNGTQEIVWSEAATRFVSMHQDPWYPGTGAADERGVGNCFNVPQPPGLSRPQYVEALWSAVTDATHDWTPDAIFVSAGYDSLAGDPLGGFTLEPADHATWITRLRERWPDRPLLALLEGGYDPDRLAAGVLATVEAMG